MNNSKSENSSPLKLLLLVLLLSIPFWILGAIAENLTKILPTKLPISSLIIFCPLLAATILIFEPKLFAKFPIGLSVAIALLS